MSERSTTSHQPQQERLQQVRKTSSFKIPCPVFGPPTFHVSSIQARAPLCLVTAEGSFRTGGRLASPNIFLPFSYSKSRAQLRNPGQHLQYLRWIWCCDRGNGPPAPLDHGHQKLTPGLASVALPPTYLICQQRTAQQAQVPLVCRSLSPLVLKMSVFR